MSERDKRWIEQYGPGQVTVRECPLCGWREWEGTTPDKPDELVIDTSIQLFGHRFVCEPCAAVAQRAPEMFRWVISCFAYQDQRRTPS